MMVSELFKEVYKKWGTKINPKCWNSDVSSPARGKCMQISRVNCQLSIIKLIRAWSSIQSCNASVHSTKWGHCPLTVFSSKWVELYTQVLICTLAHTHTSFWQSKGKAAFTLQINKLIYEKTNYPCIDML